MQKAEPQRNHAQSQPAVRQGKGASLESPQGEQLAQLEAMAEASPQVGKLAQLAAIANNSPQAAVQRRAMDMIGNSPRMAAQRRQLDSLVGETAQREEAEEPLQPKVTQRAEAPAKPNASTKLSTGDTGLPDNLKSGIESLSGMSMDNVKVHYNSSQPAQLNALAYAQGTDIHVGPGQEQHLPHEAWHVVQQAQGRVRPTMQMKGAAINGDAELEAEADVMGAKAVSVRTVQAKKSIESAPLDSRGDVRQAKTSIQHATSTFSYYHHRGKTQKNEVVGKEMTAYLDPQTPIRGTATGGPQKDFITQVRKTFPNDNMIRGHLLNHDLGGFGVEPNLFPITSAANGEHLRTVEYGVKQALAGAKGKTGVFYKVEATGDFDDTKDEPVSSFVCEAFVLKDVEEHSLSSLGKKILGVTITSTPKKTGGKRKSELRGSAKNTGGGDADNFKHSSGLSSWKHSGTGAGQFQELVERGVITTQALGSKDDIVWDADTALLYLDEYGEEINEIIDRILDATGKDSIEELDDDDFAQLDVDEKHAFDEYSNAITCLEKLNIEID